ALAAGRAEIQVLLGVEMAARDRRLHAATMHDGELAVGPDVAQAAGRAVQAEAGGAAAGRERQRRVLAADRHAQARACLLVVVAVLARDGEHEVEAVDAPRRNTCTMVS